MINLHDRKAMQHEFDADMADELDFEEQEYHHRRARTERFRGRQDERSAACVGVVRDVA